LLARAIERLFDRDHIGVGRGLMQEIDHHFEGFVRVVNDQIFFADGSEAIAIMRQNALGIARAIGFELEFGPIFLDQRSQPVDADQAIGFGDQCAVEPQLLAQQRFRSWVEALL
jgi:hypothetical protein